jgi:hypothetical protein
MKIFEISVHASDCRDGNRRMLSKPFNRYEVIAESEAMARTMVEADLGQMPYNVIASIDKGFTLSDKTPYLSKL